MSPDMPDGLDIEGPDIEGPPANHVLYQAFEALQGAARHLSATDVANAEVNLAEPRYRPLTRLCAEAAAALEGYIAEVVGLVTHEHVGTGHDAEVHSLVQELHPQE